jgi:hypothetical protein
MKHLRFGHHTLLCAGLLAQAALAEVPAFYRCEIRPTSGSDVKLAAILRTGDAPRKFIYGFGQGDPETRPADETASFSIRGENLILGDFPATARIRTDGLTAIIASPQYRVEVTCRPGEAAFYLRNEAGYFFSSYLDYDAQFAWPRSFAVTPVCYSGDQTKAIEELTLHSYYNALPGAPGYDTSEIYEGYKRPDIAACLASPQTGLADCLNAVSASGLAAQITYVPRFTAVGSAIHVERAAKNCLDFVGKQNVDDDSSCTRWGKWYADSLELDWGLCD